MGEGSKNLARVDDDEIGAADAAAGLGVDGGPATTPSITYDSSVDYADESAWFDEELSDEELAALGEEDLDDLDLDDEALLAEELSLREGGNAVATAKPRKVQRASYGHNTGDEEEAVEEDDTFDAAYDEEEALAGFDGDEVSGNLTSNGTSADVVPDRTSEAPIAPIGVEVEEFESAEDNYLPVPRISIHAFCESADTTAILEQAAIDRRLVKTHLTMHMGGISKAVDHFQTVSTPNLVILEAAESGVVLMEKLGQLAEVCDPSTKVIVIGHVNDIGLYRELIRQGVSEYIVRPRSPLQIIKAVAGLYVDPSAPPIGKTVAFVGARGGVGSSTIAHNVAWCAAEELLSDTVLLDLDLPFGTVSLDFEHDPTSGLLEALATPERLDDVLLDRLLQKHTDHLSLFTAPNLLDRDYDLDDHAFETVVDVVRGAAPTIIIDVPHVWTSWSKRLLQTADEIVITTTPDLAAFRNTKNLVDVINSARPNDSDPHLVVNQFDPKNSSVQPDQYAEHVGLAPSAVFNWEPQLFHTAATNAAPIPEVAPKTKTSQYLTELTEIVLGRTSATPKKTSFDWSKLFKM